MPNNPDDTQDDEEWSPSRRTNRHTVESIRQQLDGITQAQRDQKRETDRLRDTIGRLTDASTERGFLLRRIEERLNEIYARVIVIEGRYIAKEEHEKALAPFKKWGSWAAMLVLGMVLTAVVGTVLVKGGGH